MYSRIIQCTIKADRVNEFRDAVNAALPHIQAQEGFIDNIESLDPSTGKFCCVTIWKDAADVENYDSGLFKQIAAGLGPLMQEAPTVQTLPVEHSSVHHIRAGSAAA
jgi:quinol monooxygenase YgiN